MVIIMEESLVIQKNFVVQNMDIMINAMMNVLVEQRLCTQKINVNILHVVIINIMIIRKKNV